MGGSSLLGQLVNRAAVTEDTALRETLRITGLHLRLDLTGEPARRV